MAGFPRSDLDANNWQTVTPDDWSLIDRLKAYSSDARTALGNLGSNLLEGISPFHPDAAKAGAPSLQVPPMLQGIADSYSRLAGTPSKPGNAYDLTGVPELDAPIQGDMSNVQLSLYGGNAAAGLRRGVAAKGYASVAEMEAKGLPMDYQSMMARADAQGYDPMILYRGDNLSPTVLDPTMLGKNHPNALSKEGFFFTPEPDYAQGYGKLGAYRARLGNHEVITVDDISSLWHDPAPVREAKVRGADSVTLRDGRMPDEVVVFDPSRVRDVFQAEFDPSKVGQNGLLLSDTGKPSLLGSALATAGEQLPMDTASRMQRARDMGFDTDTTWYHGSKNDIEAFDPSRAGSRYMQDGEGTFFASDPAVASRYALSNVGSEGMLPSGLTRYETAFNEAAQLGLPAKEVYQYANEVGQTGANVVPAYVRSKNPLNISATADNPAAFWDDNFKSVMDTAKAGGHDSIVVTTPDGQSMKVVLDPKNIRSVNAAFDPAKAESANLLAAKTYGLPQGQQDDSDLTALLRRYGVSY